MGLKTRPTSDRLRETLFNVLAPRMEGARFLDLYAGSGAVGIEAVSRGAASVVLVERAVPALKVLRDKSGDAGAAQRGACGGGERRGIFAADAAGERGDAVRRGVSRSAV